MKKSNDELSDWEIQQIAIESAFHQADRIDRPVGVLLECYQNYQEHDSNTDAIASDAEALRWLDDYWEYVCSVENGRQCSMAELDGLIGMAGYITDPFIAEQVIEYLQYDDEIDEDAQNLIDRLKQITSRYNGVSKMKKSENFGYYIDNLIDLDWNHETDEPGQFYDDISEVDMLLADGNYKEAYDKLNDIFNRCTDGEMGYLIGELAGKIEARIREPIEFHKKAVLEYIISCNSCCYGEIYEYCRDIGMDDKDTDEAISELESEGKIEFVNQMDWVAKTKKMKKSEYEDGNIPMSPNDYRNGLESIMDLPQVGAVYTNSTGGSCKIIAVDEPALSEEYRLDNFQITYQMGGGDILCHKWGGVKNMLEYNGYDYKASTKKSMPSIHDMIAQTRMNNNSLTKSRVDLGIRKSDYRLKTVTSSTGTPYAKTDYYEDVDILNYELSQCNSIEEVRQCLIRNAKYNFRSEHEFQMELDGQLLFHIPSEHGSEYTTKVWISGAGTTASGPYRLEGTYTESGERYCMENVLGTDPDKIKMRIAQCQSLDEVQNILVNECPRLEKVYLLTELDGIATFINESYTGYKTKIKVSTYN